MIADAGLIACGAYPFPSGELSRRSVMTSRGAPDCHRKTGAKARTRCNFPKRAVALQGFRTGVAATPERSGRRVYQARTARGKRAGSGSRIRPGSELARWGTRAAGRPGDLSGLLAADTDRPEP